MIYIVLVKGEGTNAQKQSLYLGTPVKQEIRDHNPDHSPERSPC